MPQNIVIIGAGYAGMWSAVSASRLITSHLSSHPKATDLNVIVIAPNIHLVARPRLYESDPCSKTFDLTEIFEATGVCFSQGTVNTLHLEEKEVEFTEPCGKRYLQRYDRLIFAAGSRLMYPPIPGLKEHTFNVDQLDDAARLETHLQRLRFLPPGPGQYNIVICGAGFTGIEVATEMPSRLRAILGDLADFRVILVDRMPVVGDSLGPGPRPAVEKGLRQAGVETILGVTITSIDSEGISTSTALRIESNTVIWAAGLVAPPLAKELPGTKDALGRLDVDKYLRLPSHKDIYVAGDSACAATDALGNFSVMSCQHAIPQGKLAGHNAVCDLLNLPASPYSQPTYTTCLDLGPYGAVFTNGWERRIVVSGHVGKAIKYVISHCMMAAPKANMGSAYAAAKPTMPPVVVQHTMSTALSFLGFFAGRVH